MTCQAVLQGLDSCMSEHLGSAVSLLLSSQAVKVKTELLVPANPPILDGVNDLTSLSYLNEPSILNDLRQRYDRDQVPCWRLATCLRAMWTD